MIQPPEIPTPVRHIGHFSVPRDPRGKGRPRFGRGRVHTDRKTRMTESTIAWVAARHRPELPADGPVLLRVVFVHAIRPSWPKWKQALAAALRVFHSTKPDLDNQVKLVKDALNGACWWTDDARVSALVALDMHGPEPGIHVWVDELPSAEVLRG